MRTSQDRHHTCSSGTTGGSAFLNSSFYSTPDPFCFSNFDSTTTTHLSFAAPAPSPRLFTLESTPTPPPPTSTKLVYPSLSPPSPQPSLSFISNPSPDSHSYGSPTSALSTTQDDNQLFRELESFLNDDTHVNVLDTSNYSYHQTTSSVPVPLPLPLPLPPRRAQATHAMSSMTPPRLDLKDVLVRCATAMSDGDMQTAAALMQMLAQMVSVSGNPIQRLGAYLLEGLKARVERSGTLIYKSLKCEEPTSAELLSYMHVLYQISPFWKFAYTSANVVISQAMQNETRIHIIDFQIAQGSQWMSLIHELAHRTGGPPHICITGVDDSQSTHARGGGLHIVGEKLSQHAKNWNVPFEFHDAAAMLDSEVKLEKLRIRAGEAIAVNFPFILHHVPDESVTTHNHRDQLLRLIKGMSPKVVTLVEQESNTNTSAFLPRFLETMDYYTAMFEALDVARPRDDKQRMKAEQQCVARDIVNMVACEGAERVERHEPVRKWIARFKMAGFRQCTLSPRVTGAVREMLKEYNENYGVAEKDGALYLGWKNRAMSTCTAWM